MRLLILGLLPLTVPLAGQAPRDLTGCWVLQPSAAERARLEAQPAPPATGGRPAPALERRREGDRDLRQLGLLTGLAGAVPAFDLAQTDSTLTVTNDDGFRYVLRLGGEGALALLDSLTVRHRTRWDGTMLVVEWRPEGGGTLTERYQLADSGQYLRVDVTVEYQGFRRWDSRLYRRDP